MANKKEKNEGKRVAKTGGKSKVGLVIVICAVVVIAAAYAGLCYWAGSHVLPNSTVGGLNVGGLDQQGVSEQVYDNYGLQNVELVCGDVRVELQGDQAGVEFDIDSVMNDLSVREKPFLMRGISWLGALGDQREVKAPISGFANDEYVDGLLAQLSESFEQKLVQDAYALGEDHILVQRGKAGMSIDTDLVRAALQEHVNAHSGGELVLEPVITKPGKIDFNSIHREIYVECADAELEPETFKIIPSVTGVSFDIPAAQNEYEELAEGEQMRISLIYTEPEITTEKMEESLFADVLGEAKSWVSGSSGRKSNVKLAASFCDGTILLPGDEFSYWSMIAPCTVEQGFQPAPTYLDGKTVDGIGGGVCQMSSSIYTAALYSNLEIVQRNQHTYAVGYLPDGCDAMVSSGTSDFKFKNNTEWPLKITAGVKDGQLTVQILGTKVDDTYVKLEFKELSRTPHSTVYKIDNSIPAGTTKEEANGYTGRKNETYRCVYAGDGTLISRTLENKNNYRMRDEIILINSADAYKYGVDPVTGEKLPEGAVVTPPVTPTPEVTPAPTPSDSGTMPDWLGGGTATQVPEISPTVTPEPVPTPEAEMPEWLRPADPTED